MWDTMRDAPIGQILRFVSGNRIMRYPEEIPGYELPIEYVQALQGKGRPISKKETEKDALSRSPSTSSKEDEEKQDTTEPTEPTEPNLTSAPTQTEHPEERVHEEGNATALTKTRSIAPQVTNSGVVLVDWYTEDDQDNPQNWSQKKKAWVAFVVCLYTFVVYSGSAIYTTGEEGVMEEFGVTHLDASLPLSLYVLAYGMGPLIWSPLSEIPILGRSPVYAVTMFIFVLISIGPPLVQNFAGLLVLRYLQGFFGSPCLATGGASMQDMYSLLYLPYSLTAWVSAAYSGPALGPLLSGFAVPVKGWRWSLWEILWAAGPIFIVMALLLPETSAQTILLRKAARLRKLTGDKRLMSQSEINQSKMKFSAVFVDAIIKPMEITIRDPAIAFVNIYAAIIYGIYYSFFEVFPLVYPVYYGMNLGEVGLVFLCVLVACLIAVAAYVAYLTFYLIPDIMKNGLREQEHRLVPAVINSFGAPIGLFLFAWTARESIQWAVPTLGIVIYAATGFIVFQCIFVYVPMSYPQYAASLFAANDFFRSAFACGSVLFARPLFINLGIGKGVSTLAGLSVIGIIGMFVLYFYGAKLRARSKFAVSEDKKDV